MPTRILLTGFEPFGEIAANPSQLVVEALRAVEIPGAVFTTAVLPVAYASAGDCMRNLIREHRPDHVLALGVAGASEGIRIERVALNLDDSVSPDNDGVLRQGKTILEDGPPAYFSGLNLAGLKDVLEGAGVPVRISNHAGAYLCNHAYYAAANEVERLGLTTGVLFMHVPLPVEMKEGAQMPLKEIQRAVRLTLGWLVGQKPLDGIDFSRKK